MATWVFEPGHTAAEFRVRHMMVTWVRGHFKDVHGRLEFDPPTRVLSSLEATIQAKGLWTGEPQRDDHLRSADFLDVVAHPSITFRSASVERVGGNDYKVRGTLNVRGAARNVVLDLHYLDSWRTPYDSARVTRVGFTGRTRINRHDFGVSWNSPLENDGGVVGNEVWITIDIEGILETELRPILEAGTNR
ncbi:MAG TPA: YceI family protein [Gemmataceae bacterium]|nr:YceI family protein [Gemmataceae bacterium]